MTPEENVREINKLMYFRKGSTVVDHSTTYAEVKGLNPVAGFHHKNKLVCSSSNSAVVEHSTNHPVVKSLNPGSALENDKMSVKEIS